MSRRPAWTVCALAIVGCAGDAPPASTPTAARPAVAARFVPPADRYVKSVLLDFESTLDSQFVIAFGARRVADPSAPDNHVLLTAGPATVKLGALLTGRDFPGNWDLIGVRVRPSRNARCAITAGNGDAVASVQESLVAGRWRTLWLETSTLATPAKTSSTAPTSAATTAAATTTAAVAPMTLEVAANDAEFLIDEVMLAQGGIVVGDGRSPRTGEAWRVERRGTAWRATLGGRELVALPAAPFVEDGYRVAESSAARAVFVNPSGDTVAIDRSGRIIRSDAPAPTPAAIEVVDGPARLERNLPGDRDNDGFDESRGCYTIRAAGDRFTFRLEGTGSASAAWPTVDVSGVRPDGVVSVWVEGQLVPWVARAPDGRATFELPISLERPVDVQVRVKG